MYVSLYENASQGIILSVRIFFESCDFYLLLNAMVSMHKPAMHVELL